MVTTSVPASTRRGTSSATATAVGSTEPDAPATPVFVDLDTVLLATHRGRYGPELALQTDLEEAIGRLAEVARAIVVLVDPPDRENLHRITTAQRLSVLETGLGATLDRLVVTTCPHGESGDCDCAKPGTGLIEHAIQEHQLPNGGGWYICGDQEGVVAGRTAGLSTIRIGPTGEDHLSAVHRPDYEARDFLDAANHILFSTFAAG